MNIRLDGDLSVPADRRMRVRELMSPPPACVDQFETVMDAARRMRASGAVRIAVSDEREMFLGMLSDRDIVERCVAEGRDPKALTIGSLLQPPRPVIDPDRVADTAILAMVVRQPLAELPVVQNGLLVGVLGLADIAVPLLDGDADESDLDGFWQPAQIMVPGAP